MSISYVPLPRLRLEDLFDGRLVHYGVQEIIRPSTTSDSRLLASVEGCLWAFRSDYNGVAFTRWMGMGDTYMIRNAIYEAFGVEIAVDADLPIAREEEEIASSAQVAPEADDSRLSPEVEKVLRDIRESLKKPNSQTMKLPFPDRI